MNEQMNETYYFQLGWSGNALWRGWTMQWSVEDSRNFIAGDKVNKNTIQTEAMTWKRVWEIFEEQWVDKFD